MASISLGENISISFSVDTYEELMELLKKNDEELEAFERGEIPDDMSEECRKNWIEKCNT